MEKESNFFAAIALLSTALILNGGYLAAFLLYPSSARFFFDLIVLIAILGCIKGLNFAFPIAPVRWLHSLSFEIFAVLATVLLRPIGYLSNQKKPTGSFRGKPLLLVHGYLHDASAWLFLKRMLNEAGFGPIYTLNLIHPFRSIRNYGKLVALKAQEIEKDTQRKDLILVGHSMGGLVSSWYATQIAPSGKVTDVITIGSPLSGTYAAFIAMGPNGREMHPGSSLITTLRKTIETNSTTRFYHIASMTDQLILPYSSALTGRHPEREFVLKDIGHLSLLFSPCIANKIKKWLSSLTN